jgi:hypothetical protein
VNDAAQKIKLSNQVLIDVTEKYNANGIVLMYDVFIVF